MHLKQHRFTYSACGPFTKNKERIQKFRKTGDTKYIYRNELDKACFQHDIAYGVFKDLTTRTALDKVLRNKAFSFAKNPKYDVYRRGLSSMVYKSFDRKLKVVVLIMKLTKMNNYLKNYIKQLLRHFDSSKKIMIKILNKSKDVFVTKKK